MDFQNKINSILNRLPNPIEYDKDEYYVPIVNDTHFVVNQNMIYPKAKDEEIYVFKKINKTDGFVVVPFWEFDRIIHNKK